MNVGQKVKGFLVTRKVYVEELKAWLYEMVHERTTLKLVWLSRDEKNKTFCVAFPTIPWDDTGVFHILEHCVMGGSERYRAKSPLVEMLKTSMYTYLNAMTVSDMTFYPCSSKNEKDFENLVTVYLNNVFHPAFLKDERLFYQEGWHYSFDEDGNPSYSGIVFNEMQGRCASPEMVSFYAVMRELFPDSPYGLISGGYPLSIPDLTYEKFTEAYHKFYSPANATIVLDGDMDIEKILAMIDEIGLMGLDPGDRIELPKEQAPVHADHIYASYPITEDKAEDPAHHLILVKGTGDSHDVIRQNCISLLMAALCDNNDSPLCKPILEAGLAEDVIYDIFSGGRQGFISLEAANCSPEDLKVIEDIFDRVLREQIEVGVDKEVIEAMLVNMEFNNLEDMHGGRSMGMLLMRSILSALRYGEAAEEKLAIGDTFDQIRQKVSEGYLEKLIGEIFFENDYSLHMILEPSVSYAEDRKKALDERLMKEISLWSDEDREHFLKLDKALAEWQDQENTKEELSELPRLTLSDISTEIETYPTVEKNISGVRTLLHEIEAGPLAYVNFYFDSTGLSEEESCLFGFLLTLLGEIQTRHSSVTEINKKIRMACGNFYMSPLFFSDVTEKQTTKMALRLDISLLKHKLSDVLALTKEIFTETDFNCEEEIRDLLRQELEKARQSLHNPGFIVSRRTEAMLFAYGVARDCMEGIAWYQWLNEQEEHWDFEALVCKLKNLLSYIYTRDKLFVSITGSDTGSLLAELSEYLKTIPQKSDLAYETVISPRGIKKEAIVIPAGVCDLAMIGKIERTQELIPGKQSVAARILRLDYFWNEIRVKGGAYGAGVSLFNEGAISCYSSSDPNAVRSMEIMQKAGDHLRALASSDADMEGYILAMAAADSQVISVASRGSIADRYYVTGCTDEMRRKQLAEILSFDNAMLNEQADIFEKALSEGGFCVMGNREAVELCKSAEILVL